MDQCLYLNVSRWRPGQRIGRGHFASVYTIENNGDLVIKISRLEVEDLYNPDIPLATFKERVDIQNELAALGYTVPVEDSWECLGEEEYGVIVMKRLEPLKGYLQRIAIDKTNIFSSIYSSIQGIGKYADVITSISEIVKGIHKHGYIHGDLKLDNLMVDREGKIYLIDFDYARRTRDARLVDNDLRALEKTVKEIMRL